MEQVQSVNETVNAAEYANENRKEYDGFLFLPSFRESYDCLVRAGEIETANLLLRAIVSYGTENVIITDNPHVEVVMTSIRRTIDNQRKKYKSKKDATKKKEEDALLAEMEDLRKKLVTQNTKFTPNDFDHLYVRR